MSRVTINNELHEVFGNCVKITNGIIELLVTVDFGPRIIHFARVGMENLFYQDLEKTGLGEKLKEYDDIIRLCGGHRIWISPEVLPRCYYPDKYPVECEAIESGMIFKAPVEKVNNIQKTIKVVMDEEQPVVYVDHYIDNCGYFPLELAPWAITMMNAGAVEVVPISNPPTGLLPNRSLTFWDYTDLSDSRVTFGKEYIVLKQDPTKKQPFKIGLNNSSGWAGIFNKGQLFLKFFEADKEGEYPDNGCSYETYTNDVMLEAETLGVLSLIRPGDSISHKEVWKLHQQEILKNFDDESINEVIKKYVDM